MRTGIIRQVSLVILEDSEHRFALQLRDDISTIHVPNMWGIFGGGIEEGENPLDAAIREIEEELIIALDPESLSFIREFSLARRVFHVFWRGVTDELDRAVLGEGQDWGLFMREQIMAGEIEDRKVVPHHLEMLEWFWAHQERLGI